MARGVERTDAYPFHGIRVLDFGIGAVGVEVGRLFAEYGADVYGLHGEREPRVIAEHGEHLNAAWSNP